LLRGHVALVLGYGDDAAPVLLDAARQLEPLDIELARGAYLTAYASAMSAAYLGQGGVLMEVCRAIDGLPPPRGTPSPMDLLLQGLARMHIDGRAAAMPTIRRAVATTRLLGTQTPPARAATEVVRGTPAESAGRIVEFLAARRLI
jgi:hypothetical protein